MELILATVLTLVAPADGQTPLVNHPAGSALVLCASLGLPPEYIRAVFGPPDCSVEGRLDWRTNPDRYLLWDYTRYGIWVEWEAGPFPRTGKGPAIRFSGSLGQ